MTSILGRQIWTTSSPSPGLLACDVLLAAARLKALWRGQYQKIPRLFFSFYTCKMHPHSQFVFLREQLVEPDHLMDPLFILLPPILPHPAPLFGIFIEPRSNLQTVAVLVGWAAAAAGKSEIACELLRARQQRPPQVRALDTTASTSSFPNYLLEWSQAQY